MKSQNSYQQEIGAGRLTTARVPKMLKLFGIFRPCFILLTCTTEGQKTRQKQGRLCKCCANRASKKRKCLIFRHFRFAFVGITGQMG